MTEINEINEDEETTLEDVEADLVELGATVDAIVAHADRLTRSKLSGDTVAAEVTETIAPLLKEFSTTVHDLILGLVHVVSAMQEGEEDDLPAPNVGLAESYIRQPGIAPLPVVEVAPQAAPIDLSRSDGD